MVLTVLSRFVFTWVVDSVLSVTRIFRKLRKGRSEADLSQAGLAGGVRDWSKAHFTSPDQIGEFFVRDLVGLEEHFGRNHIRVQYHVQCIWPDASASTKAPSQDRHGDATKAQ